MSYFLNYPIHLLLIFINLSAGPKREDISDIFDADVVPMYRNRNLFWNPPRALSCLFLILSMFNFFFLLLFWSNSIPIIARNSSKTMLLPSQQLTNSSSPCTHRDSIGTSSRDCRVLNFTSQNNKARLKGSISVKGRRYGSKNASSVISNWHQPPSVSLKHFDSYLLRRSCRTITEENVKCTRCFVC